MQLTIQLMELNVPLIIGLNMVDVATQRGIKIQFDQLMKRLKYLCSQSWLENLKGLMTYYMS